MQSFASLQVRHRRPDWRRQDAGSAPAAGASLRFRQDSQEAGADRVVDRDRRGDVTGSGQRLRRRRERDADVADDHRSAAAAATVPPSPPPEPGRAERPPAGPAAESPSAPASHLLLLLGDERFRLTVAAITADALWKT